jgi:predicted ATPase
MLPTIYIKRKEEEALRKCEQTQGRFQYMQKLYGRSHEMQQLHSVYDRVRVCSASPSKSPLSSLLTKQKRRLSLSSDDHSPAVLISGRPGTGKSSLVKRFAAEINENTPCYFLYGKFTKLDGGDPFTAIREAFNGFCYQVFMARIKSLQKCKRLSKQL